MPLVTYLSFLLSDGRQLNNHPLRMGLQALCPLAQDMVPMAETLKLRSTYIRYWSSIHTLILR